MWLRSCCSASDEGAPTSAVGSGANLRMLMPLVWQAMGATTLLLQAGLTCNGVITGRGSPSNGPRGPFHSTNMEEWQ